MAELLSKSDLDAAGCDSPNCDHDHSVVWLHAVCHPNQARNVCYSKKLGEVIISCSICGEVVARFVPAATVEQVQ